MRSDRPSRLHEQPEVRPSPTQGQALASKVGALTLQRLRRRAEQALGPRFDIRAFHQEVLETGSIPLSVLEAKIEAWIALP